jgi:hypothetical protein
MLYYVDYNPDCILYYYDYCTAQSHTILNINQELNETEFFTVSRLDIRNDDYLLVMDFDYRSLICNFKKGKVTQLEGISGIFLGEQAVFILKTNTSITVIS